MSLVPKTMTCFFWGDQLLANISASVLSLALNNTNFLRVWPSGRWSSDLQQQCSGRVVVVLARLDRKRSTTKAQKAEHVMSGLIAAATLQYIASVSAYTLNFSTDIFSGAIHRSIHKKRVKSRYTSCYFFRPNLSSNVKLILF
jgi:hypothetical protein